VKKMEDEIRQRIRAVLSKEFTTITTNLEQTDEFLTLLNNSETKTNLTLEVLNEFMTLTENCIDRKLTVAVASTYLLFFEGCYVADLDEVCLLLIRNGHDLYDLLKRKYVKNLEEIGNIDISTKFRFLEEHGLKDIINEEFRELRNKIAHLDFEALDNGEISIKNNKINVIIKLKELLSHTRELVIIIAEVIAEQRKTLLQLSNQLSNEAKNSLKQKAK